MKEYLPALLSTNWLLLGTIVPFLFVLTIVVFIHEIGHYLIGRWCGIGVRAFSIGFGPELIGFNDRHGTRWKLCAIPLGGYVKFVGDMNATSLPHSGENGALTAAERKIAFYTQPVWKRAATVFAGPLFNFLLTISVFTVLFSSYGRYVMEPTVAEVRAGSPAAVAGIRPGDRFVSIDGTPVETFSDVQRLVSGRGGDPIKFVMRRDRREITITATPEIMKQKDALGNSVKVAVIGVINNQAVGQPHLVTYSVGGAVVQATTETWHVIEHTFQFLKRLVVGREDRCQLGGPVKIAYMAGKAAQLGFEWIVQLIAFLSVGIGFLNLIPIPPLDGGHLAFYAVEIVIGRPISDMTMEAIYRVGMILVLTFMGFVFWNDLFGC